MKVKIQDIDFIGSMVRRDQWPKDDLGAVAFAGRSNVGKSSLINSLLNRRNFMRVSKTPGRTQHLNFLKVNRKFYFVDLPGFGYAKVPESIRKQWGPMIEEYLRDAASLRAVVQILDIRHKPTRDDLQLLDWLEEMNIPTILVATKADKLSANQIAKSMKLISNTVDLPRDAFTIYSSETGKGRDDLWDRILTALEAPPRGEAEEDEVDEVEDSFTDAED